MYSEKVYTGLDHAPVGFDLRGRILGPNGNNLDYIKSETGAVVMMKGSGGSEPLHILLQHSRTDGVAAARSLALNLIETVKNELQQWSAQTGQTVAQTALAAPAASANNTVETANIQQANIAPAGAATPANAPVMTVRPQTVLQLMPQQQYILNQDGSQLIPLMQGAQMSGQGNYTQLTALPIAQGSIGSFPQTSVGGATQFVDANLQPVSVAQFRLSGVPNSMQTFIPNGLALSQVSLANQDSTTVSYTSLLPVSSTVSSPSANAAVAPAAPTQQKVQWSTEKVGEKQEVKYHYQVQGGEQVQLTMPTSSQTMYIPYHQLQELTSGQAGTPQFVSISSGNGVNAWPTGTSLPLPQISQLQPGTTLNPNILQLNQKPTPGNTSVINLWSAQPGSLPTQIASSPHILTPTGQVWSGQQMQISASQGTTLTPIPANTPWVRAPGIAAALPQGAELIPLNPPVKGSGGQELRAQKRMSDGSLTGQIQLRPIAPAGSQISVQDKTGGSRDNRYYSTSARDGGSSGNQLASKNSRTSSTNTSIAQSNTGSMTISTRDIVASPARQGEKSATQPNHDGSGKPSDTSVKGQSLPPNIQMYAVSNNMPGMQSVTHIPTSLGQHNSQLNQMYIVPSSQTAALHNAGLSQGTVMGQTLQMGQGNVPMLQPNQLTLPQGMQYNTVPLMQLPHQMQYITSGLNLNNPATAQQLSLAMTGQQVLNPAMLANLQPNSPNQMSQLNSTAIQSIHGQQIPGSQTSTNIQYSTATLQNTSQSAQQFIAPNSQQQVVGSAPGTYVVPTTQYANAPSQYTQQANFVLQSQNGLPQQYTSVNQQVSATTQLNQSVDSGDSRGTVQNAQQNSFPTTNTPNSTNMTQQGTFPSGVQQQTYTPCTSIAQVVAQQVYPSAGSPSANQLTGITADNTSGPQPNNFASSVVSNQQASYPQSNTPTNAFPSANAAQTGTSATFAGNQYGVPNNNRAWVGQRFSAPPGSVAQYSGPPRAGQPPPTPVPQAPTNTNYWQYS